jgi:hypothetical protein
MRWPWLLCVCALLLPSVARADYHACLLTALASLEADAVSSRGGVYVSHAGRDREVAECLERAAADMHSALERGLASAEEVAAVLRHAAMWSMKGAISSKNTESSVLRATYLTQLVRMCHVRAVPVIKQVNFLAVSTARMLWSRKRCSPSKRETMCAKYTRRSASPPSHQNASVRRPPLHGAEPPSRSASLSFHMHAH